MSTVAAQASVGGAPPRVAFAFRWQGDDVLDGWAIDVDAPSRLVTVEILINGVVFRVERCAGLIDRSEIDRVDPALQEAWAALSARFKVLAGAMRFHVPYYVPRTSPVRVTVRHAETKAVYFDEVRDLAGLARSRLTALAEAEPFIRLRAEIDGTGVVKVNARYAGREPVELAATGAARVSSTGASTIVPAPNFQAFLERREITIVQGTAHVPPDDASGGEVVLRRPADGRIIGDGADRLPLPPRLAATYAAWRMPEPHRIDRVMASESQADYFFTGYGTCVAIARALSQATGTLWRDFHRILDWGCGVGRLTQHLLAWTPAAVTGVDIDRSAIDWCTANLPRGTFAVSPLDPPVGLPSASFDLIIGISVFTHLDEATQDAWLAELQRLLAPGGTIVVSVNSEQSLVVHPHPLVEWQRMRSAGISDVAGTRLDGVLPADRGTYYRETHHTHEYLIGHWSRWFDVVAILPGAHFHHQDYVVLRHRTASPPPTRVERLARG